VTTVTQALRARISTRAFLATPLPLPLLREILDAARWAPSGGNLQPWKLIAVAGAERDAVSDIARRIGVVSRNSEEGTHAVYPPNLWEPYRSRRFNVGEEMYALLGIARTDRAARIARFGENLDFFGAPVGVFFVIDRRMGHAQWAHLGMFMQSMALAAHERGVATCFQETWSVARESLRRHFNLPETDLVYCGMALGYADRVAPVNALRSTRAAVDEFADFRGF
jgi:nitroreductase